MARWVATAAATMALLPADNYIYILQLTSGCMRQPDLNSLEQN